MLYLNQVKFELNCSCIVDIEIIPCQLFWVALVHCIDYKTLSFISELMMKMSG